MTEIQEIRQETERERSQLARSVRSGRPGRSKTSACELPSDFLSKQEKEALNGPVFTLDLKRFYTAEEFRAIPVSLQVRYLNCLFEKYWPLGTSTFSEDIFRMSKSWLSLHVKKNGYRDQLKMPGRGQNNSAAYIAARDRLTLDLAEYRKGKVEEPPAAEHIEEEQPAEPDVNPIPDQYEAENVPVKLMSGRYPLAEEPMEPLGIQEMHLTMNGFRFGDFVRLGELFRGQDVTLDIHITTRKENGNEGNL